MPKENVFMHINYPVEDIQQVKDDQHEISLVNFGENRQEDPLNSK